MTLYANSALDVDGGRMNAGNPIAVVRGGGDLGTGAALRLQRAGFRVLVTDLAQPLVIRRGAALASAIYDGSIELEGTLGERIDRAAAADRVWAADRLPVLIDPDRSIAAQLQPAVIVDAIMARRNTGTRLADAPIVIALGPGFTAGVDCHAVIETQRGHNLGRVYYRGAAAADTGTPGTIDDEDTLQVLHAPVTGVFYAQQKIGEQVKRGKVIGRVIAVDVALTDSAMQRLVAADRDASRPVGTMIRTKIDGVVRGLLRDGLTVDAGTKVADVDPRADVSACFTVSDKAWAVGGGVLEAALYLSRQRQERGTLKII
jgi:xanthine dehydrogenase accessory factor